MSNKPYCVASQFVDLQGQCMSVSIVGKYRGVSSGYEHHE